MESYFQFEICSDSNGEERVFFLNEVPTEHQVTVHRERSTERIFWFPIYWNERHGENQLRSPPKIWRTTVMLWKKWSDFTKLHETFFIFKKFSWRRTSNSQLESQAIGDSNSLNSKHQIIWKLIFSRLILVRTFWMNYDSFWDRWRGKLNGRHTIVSHYEYTTTFEISSTLMIAIAANAHWRLVGEMSLGHSSLLGMPNYLCTRFAGEEQTK